MTPISSELRESTYWPYLAAAAVLTDFAAEKLLPLGGGKPDIAKVAAMLDEHGEPIRNGPAAGRWTLSNTSRRAVLAELKQLRELKRAVATDQGSDRPDNPTQHWLEALLLGRDPETRGRSLVQLLGLEQAIDLAAPAIQTEASVRAKVIERVELLRLMEPLQRLARDAFAGRKGELKVLRSYVDELPSQSFLEWLSRKRDNVLHLFRHRPPLVIFGPGGVGKSTLVARFLLDHADPDEEQPLPFIFLDFDGGHLDPLKPDTLLAEALRQIRIQFPQFERIAGQLVRASETRTASEDAQNISRSGHFERSSQLRRDFVDLLQQISAARERSVLLFVDTFEVVQRRGTTPAFSVLKLAAELLEELPNLRLVIAGRGPLRDADFAALSDVPKWKPLHLDGFDREAGRAYLAGRLAQLGKTQVPDRMLDRIVALVHGNPLSLRLAAQVFAKEDFAALEDAVGQARFDAAFNNERIQGMLHNRLVNQLEEPLRRLADPGLIVRRITPDVIEQVLAGPCQLALEPGDAASLFQRLKDEVALVEPVGNALRHRPDVRLLMLPLLRKKLAAKADAIDEAAASFWRDQDDPDARAEEIYHRLWLRSEPAEIDACWRRGPVAQAALEDNLYELETLDVLPAARIWLCGKLNREIPPSLEKQADQVEWERHAELRARNLLSNAAPEDAVRTLRSRSDRTPDSVLWLLEIDALKLLGRDEEALEVVRRALVETGGAAVPEHVLALLLEQASLHERSEQLAEAEDVIEQASELARMIHHEVLQFETSVTRVRIARKLDREDSEAVRRIAAMVDVPAVAEALSQRPALLAEAAAEVGDLRPDLLVLLASRVGTSNKDPQVEARMLSSLGIAYARSNSPEKAIEVLQQAHRIAIDSGVPELQAAVLNNLGRVYGDVGRLDEAISTYQRSAAVQSEIPDKLRLNAYEGLAAAYAHANDFDAAIRHLETARSVARHLESRSAEARVVGKLGILAYEIRDLVRAEELHRNEIALAESLDDGTRRGVAHYHLALVLEAMGRREEARAAMQRADDELSTVDSPLAQQAEAWLQGDRDVGNANVPDAVFEGALRDLRDSTRASVEVNLKQSLTRRSNGEV